MVVIAAQYIFGAFCIVLKLNSDPPTTLTSDRLYRPYDKFTLKVDGKEYKSNYVSNSYDYEGTTNRNIKNSVHIGEKQTQVFFEEFSHGDGIRGKEISISHDVQDGFGIFKDMKVEQVTDHNSKGILKFVGAAFGGTTTTDAGRLYGKFVGVNNYMNPLNPSKKRTLSVLFNQNSTDLNTIHMSGQFLDRPFITTLTGIDPRFSGYYNLFVLTPDTKYITYGKKNVYLFYKGGGPLQVFQETPTARYSIAQPIPPFIFPVVIFDVTSTGKISTHHEPPTFSYKLIDNTPKSSYCIQASILTLLVTTAGVMIKNF